jgi:hypothetical protein
MEWYEMLSLAIGIAGFVFGAVFYSKWNLFIKVLKETADAFYKTAEVLEDRKVTKQEALDMLSEWMEVYTALLSLLPQKLIEKILSKWLS